MKQKQLLRTLLAAVCLLVGQSVWADRVYFNDFSTGNGTTNNDTASSYENGTDNNSTTGMSTSSPIPTDNDR